jgi:predicted RNA-binding Zn-ribbon protein involved in translation (DUF1610 family)
MRSVLTIAVVAVLIACAFVVGEKAFGVPACHDCGGEMEIHISRPERDVLVYRCTKCGAIFDSKYDAD